MGSRGQEAWALGVSLGGLVPPPSPECPRQEQDIAFLIDGSGSISSTNFNKMLNFVKAMMSQFQSPSSQVCSQGREGKGAAAPAPSPPQGKLVGGTPGSWCLGPAPSPVWFPQFSLVQFSDKFHVHFNFKAFATSSNPLSLLNSVWKLNGYTHTATAIRMVT